MTILHQIELYHPQSTDALLDVIEDKINVLIGERQLVGYEPDTCGVANDQWLQVSYASYLITIN